MPFFDFIWETTDDGNVAHIAAHGLKPEDVEDLKAIRHEPTRPLSEVLAELKLRGSV